MKPIPAPQELKDKMARLAAKPPVTFAQAKAQTDAAMTPQDPTALDRQDQPVSDQPAAETDAKCGSAYEFQYSTEVVCADFARTLERQRDAAIKVCQEWDKLSIELIAERDAARAELERVKADFEFIRNNRDRLKIVLVEAGKDADRLRADLAAAREERDNWKAAAQEHGSAMDRIAQHVGFVGTSHQVAEYIESNL